jgi:hypothetical protein
VAFTRLLLLIGGPTLVGWLFLTYTAAQHDGMRYDLDPGCAISAQAKRSFCTHGQLAIVGRPQPFSLQLTDERGNTYSEELTGADAATVWTAAGSFGEISGLFFDGTPVLLAIGNAQAETSANPDWRRHNAYFTLVKAIGAIAFLATAAVAAHMGPSQSRLKAYQIK